MTEEQAQYGEKPVSELDSYQHLSTLNGMVKKIHGLAREKGWYDGGDRSIPEILCLIHSEASEALEEYRCGRMGIMYEEKSGNRMPKPIGFSIEVADVIIRVLDMCGYLGIDIEEAIRVKHEYNQTRPYRHGNKVC